MVTESFSSANRSEKHHLSYDDPFVIGVGALVIGFALGSGRWNWLGQGVARIAESMGNLMFTYFSQALQERNPDVFSGRSRTVH